MACDEDLFPWICLICGSGHMTADDLFDHIEETYGPLIQRFYQDQTFMPEFQRCLECEQDGRTWRFRGIGDIMCHIQDAHPNVMEDVSETLTRYWSEVQHNSWSDVKVVIRYSAWDQCALRRVIIVFVLTDMTKIRKLKMKWLIGNVIHVSAWIWNEQKNVFSASPSSCEV